MADIPNSIQKFTDLQKDFGTSIAQSLWQKAGQLQNYVNLSYPVGMLMFFEATQANLPAMPDLNYWKFCDGSVISNANSPMNGQNTPDLRDKFWRHKTTGELVMSTGGSDTVNISHNHGGVTGAFTNLGTINMDNGAERQTASNHAHSIATTPQIVSTVLHHHAVQVYLRIV